MQIDSADQQQCQDNTDWQADALYAYENCNTMVEQAGQIFARVNFWQFGAADWL